MALAADILAAYRGPRRAFRRQLAAGESEPRALFLLMLACGLVFVGRWPALRRDALLDGSVAFDARVGGALLAWIFAMPLVLYAVAAASHLLGRAAGGRGSPFAARLALFWSLLAASPLWALHGLAEGLLGRGLAQKAVGAVALGAFLLFWAAAFREAQRAP